MNGKENRRKLLLMLPMLHQGGFERVAVATARLLSEDYDVALCIFSDRNIHYDVSGLTIVNLNVPSEKSRVRKIINVLRRVRKAGRVRKNYDICYSFGNTANLINILSAPGPIGRLLGSTCATITGERCGTDLENRLLTRGCVLRSSLVLACSRELESLLQRDFGAKRTRFLYNPLDVAGVRSQAAERTVKRQPDTFTVVTMGRDDIIKAHWHLIKAFALVAGQFSGARLVIIGAGKYTAYRRLAEELGVDGKITWTGALTNPFPEVAAADLYVLPSNHEGFPNALVEAMALGKPVIATDCRSGPREILLSDEELQKLLETAPYGVSTKTTIDGKYGILIPDMPAEINTDPQVREDGEAVLAKQITRMIQDPGLRRHYAEQALLRADDYTPERYRQELLRILDKSLEEG
ncbi:MAG: glycosyltransferase [Lachnospiraceae bacterium]|nr:glycosyltransferase [Lachnospiraceae bacterium]